MNCCVASTLNSLLLSIFISKLKVKYLEDDKNLIISPNKTLYEALIVNICLLIIDSGIEFTKEAESFFEYIQSTVRAGI